MSTFRNILIGIRRMFMHMFMRKENTQMSEVVVTLKEVKVFRNFSRSALRDLAEAVHVRDYKRDEFIYYERDPGLGLYIVRQGRIRLLVEDEDGGVFELRQLRNNETFGQLSILGDFRRMETAQAVTDTQLLGFFRPDLKTLIKRHPSTGAAVVEGLAYHIAAREVEMVRQVAEKEGKVTAMRILEGIAVQIEKES